MKTLEQHIDQLNQQHENRILFVKHDYEKGMNDCKLGVYDKWYRYHRSDDGQAYDLGWMAMNKEVQNESVKFLYNN